MRRAAAVLTILTLTACEAPERPTQASPPPTVVERAGPIAWNAETRAFELGGEPIRAVKLWTFEDSTEGFTASAGEVLPAERGGLRVELQGPSLRSPRGLAVDGSVYSLVIVRLTRLKAGGDWNGALYYVTPDHPESGEFFGKPVLGGDPAVGETATLVYDMGRQTVGGEDWKTSLVDQIRLDLEDQPGGAFVIRQIAIARKTDLSTFAPVN